MEKVPTSVVPGQTIEDLGGPTPENYTNEPDGPAKLRDASLPLKQVRDVVNKGAKPAQGMEKVDADVVPGSNSGGTTDAPPAGSQAEKVPASVVPGQTRKEEIETEGEVVEEITSSDIAMAELDIEEDVNALLSGEELSEEFQSKARVIFEAAIRNKVAIVKEDLQDAYEEKLTEELATIRTSLSERVDAYLEYVADEWMAENAIAVEHGLRTEMTESFLQGMHSLFSEHYVSVPEERFDVVESMVERLDEMESNLNEQIERNVALNSRLSGAVSETILADVSEGLAETQKDKLAALAENVEFDSETGYREKLESLKESYFSLSTASVTARNSVEDLTESVGTYEAAPELSAQMASLVEQLDRFSK
ncbi:MAG: T4 prohead core scaffold protein [Gammaproteobacteria bacterium]|nr:T4 prohead core scaffold protein [Gammaproteobacteria bacterium]